MHFLECLVYSKMAGMVSYSCVNKWAGLRQPLKSEGLASVHYAQILLSGMILNQTSNDPDCFTTTGAQNNQGRFPTHSDINQLTIFLRIKCSV
jgi:hypothetical protein